MKNELGSISIVNDYSRLLENLELQIKEIQELGVKFAALITPMDKEEKRWGRRIEMLTVQEEFLTKYFNKNEKCDSANLDAQYKAAIQNLLQDFLVNCETVFKSRSYIYDEKKDKLIQLANAEGNQTNLEVYQQYLHETQQAIYEEVDNFYKFDFRAKISLETLTQVQNEKRSGYLFLSAFLNEKTRIADEWQNKEELLRKQYQRTKKLANQYIEYYDDKTALVMALKEGILNEVNNYVTRLIGTKKSTKGFLDEYLFPKGEESEYGRTMLHYACLYGHAHIVNYLLQNGANPNVRSLEGYYPAHEAVKYNNRDTTKILDLLQKYSPISLGILKGLCDQTPLHTAAFFDNFEGALWLLSHGRAKVDARENYEGAYNTPLQSAIKKGYRAIFDLLIFYGADTRIANMNGETALALAIIYERWDLAQILLEQGQWLTAEETRVFLQRAKQYPNTFSHIMKRPLQSYFDRAKELMLNSQIQSSHWDSFDTAIGLKDRSVLVNYALENASNEEFRYLLAPEIRENTLLTVIALSVQDQGKLDISMSFSSSEIHKVTKAFRSLCYSNKENILPNEMRTQEMQQLASNYLTTKYLLKEASAKPDSDSYNALVAQASKSEKAFNDHCIAESTYRQYVLLHY